jgi:glycosyltransferase involved in cell wall biosynthesis
VAGDGPPAAARRLRVLHVRNSDRLGGPERLLLDQCARGAREIEAVVASFGAGGEPHAFLDAAAREGVATVSIPQRSSYDLRLVARLRRVVKGIAPDVVVSHDYKADLLAAAALQGRGPAFVAVVHGYTAEDAKIRAFEAVDRRVLRRTHAVVAPSESVAAVLVAAGIDPAKVRVIENGVAVDRVGAAAAAGRDRLRREWGIEARERVVLALGRLSPEKGQDVLLEAFASLPAAPGAPLRLVFVGDGALRPSLEARVAELAAAGRLAPRGVVFAGWRDDPHACLGAADVFALPSRREGLPLALLEAMAAALPIVATEVGGVVRALDGGRCGLVVPAGRPADLGAALASLLADRALCSRLVAAASDRVRAHYSVDRQTRALARVYAEAHVRSQVDIRQLGN